jgi:hypothetical protein
MKATVVDMGHNPTTDEVIILSKVGFPYVGGISDVYVVYPSTTVVEFGTFFCTQTCAREQFRLNTAVGEEYEILSAQVISVTGRTYAEMKTFLER